jgi:hypothetical protein
MIGYPYWARVLVDEPSGAQLSRGDMVIIGGPTTTGGIWAHDYKMPNRPWALRDYHVERVDTPVSASVPHAGKTLNPWAVLPGKDPWIT